MQNAIQIFENQEFGQLGILMIDGKPYFPASDCAKALGYKDTINAIKRHCKGVAKRHILTAGGNQTANYIPEGDLYRLIIRSKLPSALRFETWVFNEVLPTIRKHGAYINEDVISRMQGIGEDVTLKMDYENLQAYSKVFISQNLFTICAKARKQKARR